MRKIFLPVCALMLFVLLMGQVVLVSMAAPLIVQKPAPVATYVPEPYVPVTMYRLNPSGTRRDDALLCTPGDTNWGCTAFCDTPGTDYDEICRPGGIPLPVTPYPYASSRPTVHVQNDYLPDVVSQEMGPSYEPAALQALAIAARSFIWWYKENDEATIENSTRRQAFIPLKFDSLNLTATPNSPYNPCASTNLNADQTRICAAVAPQHYLAQSGVDAPARAEHFSDVVGQTAPGSDKDYLASVVDPISTACGATNDISNHWGMSQRGANRWARGNQCHLDSWGDTPWSVAWSSPTQILVHYYTGVHVRDASNDNTILSPANRWNPLSINWGTPNNHPPIMVRGGSYTVMVRVQNTSIADWTTNGQDWALSYHWAKTGHGDIDSTKRDWIVGTVSKGDPPYNFVLTINDRPDWGRGAYTLKFDMVLRTYGRDYWFSRDFVGSNWMTYDVEVQGEYPVFLPVVLNGSAAMGVSDSPK